MAIIMRDWMRNERRQPDQRHQVSMPPTVLFNITLKHEGAGWLMDLAVLSSGSKPSMQFNLTPPRKLIAATEALTLPLTSRHMDIAPLCSIPIMVTEPSMSLAWLTNMNTPPDDS